MRGLLHRLLCKLGWHRWNPDVPEADCELIRSTGIHFAFSSSGIQRGTQRCMHCPASRLVYRQGIVSAAIFPSSSGTWKRCSPQRSAEIESYPLL